MLSLFTHVSPPSRCSYLPDQLWSLTYEYFAEVSAADYEERLKSGWRRFGRMLFTPKCRACSECRSLRIPVQRFRPNRSQRRARNANQGDVRLRIGVPRVTQGALDLYDRYHAFQTDAKGWPYYGDKSSESYAESFVDNPFPTEEWQYWREDTLVGIGYVDVLPGSLSAIYFFYEPAERARSLGTYNVLCLLDSAARRELDHVYLGYFVAGCGSMEYKARFRPHQLLGADGRWRDAT